MPPPLHNLQWEGSSFITISIVPITEKNLKLDHRSIPETEYTDSHFSAVSRFCKSDKALVQLEAGLPKPFLVLLPARRCRRRWTSATGAGLRKVHLTPGRLTCGRRSVGWRARRRVRRVARGGLWPAWDGTWYRKPDVWAEIFPRHRVERVLQVKEDR